MTDEVFGDDSGIPWVMVVKRKVDDAGDEMTKNKENQLRRGARDQEKEHRRVLVTVESLIFSVIALKSMMTKKRSLRQHLELGDHGDKDHFPDQQYTLELMVPKAPQWPR